MKRPNALCIAAHDPSAGAGLLADIKTLESHDVYGCGITTGITFQNDIMFQGVEWMQYSNINSQLLMVSERFDFEYAKIGMIKDLDMLDHIIALLYDTFPVIKIIWDPVMSTSSGFQIHFSFPFEKIIELARDLYLITPNMEEIKMIFPELSEENGAKLLAKKTNVLLKGGHAPGVESNDTLFTKAGKKIFESKRIYDKEKHGTGCVLSSSIMANLTLGMKLNEACAEAKNYVEQFINSDDSLIGYHHNQIL